MQKLTDEAQEYYEEYCDWREDYEIYEFIEATGNNEEDEKICARIKEEYGNNFLWTEHGTCEDPRVSNGANVFSKGCGCWDNRGWWVGRVAWADDAEADDMEYFRTIATELSSHCSCNPDGENEVKAEDCDDPECYEGWTRWFFEEMYVEDEEKDKGKY